ncbi:MAG TPA: hypothetical protein VKB03_16340 [Conexibacter sp.]|nr:hypothetical protein [Conexibacter sp.]
MTLPRLSLVLALTGVGLALAGVLVGPAGLEIEGAYFTRAAGTPAHSGVFNDWSSGDTLLSPHDGNLWLGAGIVCLLLAGGALLAHVRGLGLMRVAD